MLVTPMFPLQVAMLPGEELPLRIFEPRYAALVSDCLAQPEAPAFGVVLISAGREVGGGDMRSDVGAMARIAEAADLGEGRYRLRCVMAERIREPEGLRHDRWVINKIRALASWYTKGLENGSHLRIAINSTDTLDGLRQLIGGFFAENDAELLRTA